MKTAARFATRTGLTVALLGVGLAALTPGAQAQKGFKEALPEHTLIYMAAPDLETWVAGFKTSAVYKIWVEEEVQEFVADLLAEGNKYFTMYMGMAKQMHEAGQLPVDPAKLMQIRVKGISFAVTDLVVPGGQQPAMISAVGCVDFGETGQIVQEAFGVLHAMLQAQAAGGKFRLESKDVGGSKLHMVLPPEEAAQFSQMMPTFALTWGFVGGKLLFGTDVKRVGALAAALGGAAPEKGLPDNAMYRRVAQRVSAGRSDMEIYMRPGACIDVGMAALRFGAQMNPDMAEIDVDGVDRVLETLGLKGLKAIGFASGYEDGKGFFKGFVMSPEDERKGLLALGGTTPVNMDHLGWIPKNVGSFSIGNMGNLEDVYGTIMKAVAAYDEGMGQLAAEKVAEVEKGLEMNIKKDIFGAFGPEMITYSMPVTGLMATPEMVFMLGCKNQDRTLEVLKKLCALTDGVVSINESKTEEGTYHTIDLVLDDVGMGMDPTSMLDPTFTFKDGYLVFGMSRSDVKGALKRFGGTGGEDVRANPAFKPYLDRIPKAVASLSFTDVASTVDGVYGTLSGVLGMVPIPPDVPVDLGLLPSVDTITKHLFGSVTWSTMHADGTLSESVGPFGPEMVMALGGVVVGGAAAAVGMARSSEARVRRIGR